MQSVGRTWWMGLVLPAMLCLVGCPKGHGGREPERPATPPPAPPAPKAVDYTAADVGELAAGPGAPSDDPGAWPQFRGAARDNIARDAKGLYRDWPAGGPKLLWRIEGLGLGYSGPAVYAGRVFFHDYDEANKRWVARCVSLADGRDIWRWSYPRDIPANHGVTRTVPATDGRRVFSLDPLCVLHCFDAATGGRLWAHDLVAEYGAVPPQWYNGQCPLIEPDRVIVGVGGKQFLMAAFDAATGRPIWQARNQAGHPMSHPSVMPMTLCGRRQYVWSTMKGVVGVDPVRGRLLWQRLWPREASDTDFRPSTAVAPSPLDVGGDRILMTAGYEAGAALLKVEPAEDGTLAARVLWKLEPRAFNSDTQTPTFHAGRVFAVHGNDEFTCLDLDGKVVWKSPRRPHFGLGPSLLADGLFFVLEGNTGRLHLVDADAAEYKELAAADVLGEHAHEAWAPMALADGKLICRDLTTMVCLEVGGAEAQP